MPASASRALLFISLSFGLVGAAGAAETLPPAEQRYRDASAAETPDFQRHIVPLLGRQGCNGRSCHGSFQGRGGFRLSLFGYDMKFDHEALTRLKGDADELRVNTKVPRESLMLVKTADESLHEGGQRLVPGSWEYHVFLRWIEQGCPAPRGEQRLVRLEVSPAEILYRQPGQTTQLKVTAVWPDGTREDVTCLARFRTNDEGVAQIDDHGRVTAQGSGDTHVVAFYDNGVAAVPVVMPYGDGRQVEYPQNPATEIDRLILAKLRKLGIGPSALCDDAEFLRRVSLDMTGTLPTAEEVTAFLADGAAGKRARKISELLERPEYAAWWATKFCDLTGNNPRAISDQAFRNEQSQQWYDWLRARLAENMPYDELVEGLLLASSRRPGQSYPDYVREMVGYLRADHPASFTDHPNVPQYWSRNSFRTPEDRVLGISHSFLGVRIQCAQCHKHPFDQWTQQDFRDFSRFFAGVSYGVDRDARDEVSRMEEELGIKGVNGNEQRRKTVEAARRGDPVPLREVFVASLPRSSGRGGSSPAKARLLGGEEIDLSQVADPREPVMQWLRRPDNPYFAKALVNRVWAHYFGRGIIEPADDLNLANPPSNGPLLDYLARGFVDHGYDLKWLHREITASEAYQRSWRPSASNAPDRRNFSRMLPRRLPAEVAYDAVVQATTSDKKLAELRAAIEKRAISNASTLGSTNRYAVQVFGKPERVTTCDCERSAEPTLLQSLFLQNDREMLALIDRGGWAAEAAKAPPAKRGEVIDAAYLRTLSRLPSPPERDRALEHLAAAATPADGVRDLLWALLNTREFIVNH